MVWLKHALRVDIYCSEALEFLVDRKLLRYVPQTPNVVNGT